MRRLLGPLNPRVPLGLGGRFFVAVLSLAYGWVLLTPIVPAVSKAGMLRFNLMTESFGAWAIQQPIPSMYNFSNRACVGPVELESRLPYRQMNHFPTRLFTFTNRDDYTEALPMILKSRSTYQGRRVEVIHLIEKAPGGMKMTAMFDPELDD